MDLERFPTSPSAKRMLSSVSEEFYAKSYVAKWLYQVMGLEWDDVWSVIDALPEQAFVETATWGLMYHEIKWGLPVRENLDYETRRRLIYEKRDVRKPMNPWAMERLVHDLTGEDAFVTDSNDNPKIPANTFFLRIENHAPVNLIPIINSLMLVKQSHTTFSIRVKPKNIPSVPLRIGAAGGIQTRRPPAEQPDNLYASHTLRAGGRAALQGRLPPVPQPDGLRGADTLRAAVHAMASARLPPTEQPDAPPRPGAIRQGGTGAVISTLRGRLI